LEAEAVAQNLVVAMLVAGCFVYALWSLAPKAPRGRLATALLQLPLPGRLQKALTAAARQQGGCGCDGCDCSNAVKQAATTCTTGLAGQPEFQPLTFMPGNYAKKARR
jgi:hypothetical protein